jgi:small subunit ribosomal protein S8
MGICLVSTNQGILSSREAKKAGVGGEVLCTVY